MIRTRSITEGAILIALYTVLLLATFYIPFVGIILMFALAVPFIVYTYRHDIKASILFFVTSIFITYMTVGLMVIPLTLMFGSSGIVIGYLYSKKKESFSILIAGSIAYILNLVFLYGAAVLLFKVNFIEQATVMLKESIEQAEKMMLAMGQEPNAENIELFYQQLEIVQYIIPSLLVMTGIIFAFITQVFSNKVLKRLNADIQPFPPFREWRFPQSLLWYYLIVIILMFIGAEEGSSLYIVIMNTYYVLEMIMVVQGLSFVYFFSHLKKWPVAIPVIIMILTFTIPILLNLTRILGIIDLGFDLRKRIMNNGNKK